MLKVDNKYIDITVENLIKTLKFELSKEGLSYFRDIKHTTNDIMVTCPFHKHGNESKPSCGINMDTGVYHCFTCGASGPIERMVSYCLGHDTDKYGVDWIKSTFDNLLEARPGIELNKREKIIKNEYITEAELDSYRYTHPYMYKRRLTDDIIEKYDIGYDKNTQCITFPVKDLAGNVVFIARRSVNSKFFNYPQGVDKPVYGLEKHINDKYLYVTESFINCLTLESYGLPAVALIGTGSGYQYNILKKSGIRKFILCLDGDAAGDRGIIRFKQAMPDYIKVSYKKCPRDGRDINDLTKEEFEELPEINL